MNTCGTCKHWGDEHFPYFVGLKPCLAVLHVSKIEMEEDEYGPVDGVDACYVAKGGTPRAMVTDASGYHAALKTREDFGCALWEAKS